MEACLAGEKPDRTPVALWRHFPVDDQSAEGLTAATLAFQQTYDFDFVKVSPSSSFCLKDWGVEDEWQGNTEGTRAYTKRVIRSPEDWGKLKALNPKKGHLGTQLRCLELLVKELGEETPIIQTIFSPLSQAKNLIGAEGLLVHLRRHPEALHAGLKTITESTQRFVEAASQTGIAGVFYAVQHAQYGLLAEQEFEAFVQAYDLQALEPAKDLWLNVLHLHGDEIMFEYAKDYPVQVVNWHDQETPPSLAEGQNQFSGAVCGGLKQWDTMAVGTGEQVAQEAQAAIEATGGRRFILGTGCVTPIIAPHGNLMAARKAVELN